MDFALAKFDNFILDCDGVLWQGNDLIPGSGSPCLIFMRAQLAAETLQVLQKMGKRLLFVTNNSTSTRAQYVPKLQKMGISVTQVRVILISLSS